MISNHHYSCQKLWKIEIQYIIMLAIQIDIRLRSYQARGQDWALGEGFEISN